MKQLNRLFILLLLGGTIAFTFSCSGNKQVQKEVKATVRQFGEQLKKISLQAPDSLIAPQIQKIYKPYVMKELLQKWVANPASAPGRIASSPWPKKIRIKKVSKVNGQLYRVKGKVIYITSLEKVKGGAAMRKKVIIEVKKANKGQWQISKYIDQ